MVACRYSQIHATFFFVGLTSIINQSGVEMCGSDACVWVDNTTGGQSPARIVLVLQALGIYLVASCGQTALFLIAIIKCIIVKGV